ncbi:MAG: peptidoglycan recognition family protein [Tepidisphaeraceae bacterium]
MRIALATLLAVPVVLLCACAVAQETPDKPQVAKPPIVTREEWGSQPKPMPDARKHTPQFITVHHAGVDWKPGRDPRVFVKNMQVWGQNREKENAALPPEKRKPNIKDWPDLAYHFMIAPDGRIFEARPMDYEPESNTRYDLQGHIGVELMGNFETQRPSDAQLKSLVAIVSWVCQEKKIDPSQIGTHRDRAKKQTVCPGKDLYRYFDDGTFVGWVKETLAGKSPDVMPGPAHEGGPTIIVNTPTTQPAAAKPQG